MAGYTIEEMVESTTRLLREQISESPIMARPGGDGQLFRYAFAVGGLLAHLDDEVKGELMRLIRFGLEGAVDPGESVDLPGSSADDGRPAGMLGGPFVGSDDPALRFAE